MALSAPHGRHARAPPADHGFHPLRVAGSVRETADASSFVLDVPAELRRRLRLRGRPVLHLPGVGRRRAPPPLLLDVVLAGGRHRAAGDGQAGAGRRRLELDERPPRRRATSSTWPRRPASSASAAGDGRRRRLRRRAAASPRCSRSSRPALATTSRRVRLLYANRDRDAIIFARRARRPRRRATPTASPSMHHLDVDDGFVGPDDVAARFVEAAPATPSSTSAGPGPFMDIVEADPARRRRRRRAASTSSGSPRPSRCPSAEPVATRPPATSRVTIELDGRTDDDRPPAGHDDPADGPPDGHVAAVLVRVGELRHLHGQAGRGHGHHARQQRPRPTTRSPTAGCSPARRCRPSPSVHVVYGYEEG